MKFCINRNALLSTLINIKAVVFDASPSIASHQIIEIKAEKDQLVFYAHHSGQTTHLMLVIPTTDKNYELSVTNLGNNYFSLPDLIKDLALGYNEFVKFATIGDDQMQLEHGFTVTCKLIDTTGIDVTANANALYDKKVKPIIECETSELIDVVDKVIYATLDKDPNPSLPVLKGINLSLKNKKIMLTATDSFRLSVMELEQEVSGTEFSKTNAKTTLASFAKFKNNFGSKIKIAISDEYVYFKSKNLVIIARAYNQNYPNLTEVIADKSYKHYLTFDRMEFLNKLRNLMKSRHRIALNFDSKAQKVTFNTSSTSPTLGSPSNVKGSLEEKVKISGTNLKIVLNIRYLYEAIRCTSSKQIKLMYKDSESAIKIVDPNLPNLIMFISPMTIE